MFRVGPEGRPQAKQERKGKNWKTCGGEAKRTHSTWCPQIMRHWGQYRGDRVWSNEKWRWA